MSTVSKSQCRDQTPLKSWKVGDLVCAGRDCDLWGIVASPTDGMGVVVIEIKPYRASMFDVPPYAGSVGQGPKSWHRLDVERIVEARRLKEDS